MLRSEGLGHVLLDANLEALLHLLRLPLPEFRADDTWSKRSFRHCSSNLSGLRTPELYRHPDRYRRAVKDAGRVLADLSPEGRTITFADYTDQALSPTRSADLLQAAAQPSRSPFYPYFSLRLRQLFEAAKPSAVGISLNYLSQALTAFAMTGFIRKTFPGVKIIAGGGLITSWMRSPAWKDPFGGLIDHLIAGPGEYQLAQLSGKPSPSLQLPQPDYSALPAGDYLSPGFILPYSASSGCYWNRCDFCPEEAEQNPYRAVPPEQAVRQLRALTEQNSPSLIHLLDNAVSPALLEALCRERPLGPWYGFVRVNSLLADPDFCRALKKAGAVMLKLGIESGDQAVLDALRKGIRTEEASRVLRNLKKAGIATYVYLLFGTPPETEESARKTLAFTEAHGDCIDFLNLAIFNMPLCGSSAAASQTRRFSEGDLSLYTGFEHPEGWDRKKVRLFLDREFRRNRTVASILKNEVPVFTSNHAPFFVG